MRDFLRLAVVEKLKIFFAQSADGVAGRIADDNGDDYEIGFDFERGDGGGLIGRRKNGIALRWRRSKRGLAGVLSRGKLRARESQNQ